MAEKKAAKPKKEDPNRLVDLFWVGQHNAYSGGFGTRMAYGSKHKVPVRFKNRAGWSDKKPEVKVETFECVGKKGQRFDPWECAQVLVGGQKYDLPVAVASAINKRFDGELLKPAKSQ